LTVRAAPRSPSHWGLAYWKRAGIPQIYFVNCIRELLGLSPIFAGRGGT
jgi:hypothetical protein